MPRLFVPVVAILVVAAVLVPGLPRPAAARQASPAASPAADCPATTAQENEALVSRYYDEAYNGRNLEVVDELLADDFIRHNVAVPQQNQAPGNADDVARIESWLSAFPDLQIAVEDLYATSDTVVSYVIWSGSQDGPLPQFGAPVTGRPMERESLVVWRVACGQLAENWIVQDNLTMLRQLGIITDDELATAGTPTVATPAP
jgi:predicted ester cyclase